MALSWLVDGIDLGATFGLTDGTTWRPPLSMRTNVVEINGRPGAIIAGESMPTAATVTLRVLLQRDTEADMETAARDLGALLSRPVGVTLTRVSGGSSVDASARLVSLTPDDLIGSGLSVQWTAVLSVPDGVFRDQAPASTALAVGSTALDVGSAPVTDAVIRFALDAANPILTDGQTGTGISVAYDAVATDYIYVDCGQLQAWKSASSSQWTRPSSSAAWLDALVSYPGPGPLRMTPAVTESGGVLSRLATLTSSHTASVRFKKAWW